MRKSSSHETAEAVTSTPQTIATSRLEAASPIRLTSLPKVDATTFQGIGTNEMRDFRGDAMSQPQNEHRSRFARHVDHSLLWRSMSLITPLSLRRLGVFTQQQSSSGREVTTAFRLP